MSQPRGSQVHVDSILTNISVAYIQNPNRFIATRVFPMLPVDKQSDKYFVYTKGDWFRDEAKKRAPGGESAGSGYGISNATYSCDVFAFHKDVPRQIIDNADLPINPVRDATEFVTQRLLMRLEKQWVADYFTTGVWQTDLTPTNLWSDYSNSDPIDDIETAKQTILLNTGYMPNKLVLGYQVFRKLKHHPDIVDRFKYTTSKVITAEILAGLFEVDEVIVASSVENTAVEGASDSFSFIHGKHALLCYAAPTPGLLAPSAGYIFVWRGISGSLGQNVAIDRFELRRNKADRIEGEIAFDDRVVATDLGYFFNGAVL